MEANSPKSERTRAASALLMVFACFTLSSAGYLSWTYHLVQLVGPSNADILSMGAGYTCQAIGIAGAIIAIRARPEAAGSTVFIALLALNLACTAPAAVGESLAETLAFGLAMNVLCGVIDAYYLMRLAAFVREGRRGIVFGGGYACSVVASWLVSMAETPLADVPVGLLSCIVFSACAVAISLAVPFPAPDVSLARETRASESADGAEQASMPESDDRRGKQVLFIVACVTVFLISMVNNMGFGFPLSDVVSGVNLEMSRLFYAIGLVIAGLIIDYNRKYGAVLCMAGLAMPFAIMALSDEPIPSVAFWAIGYLLYGFLSVFRVTLFADLSTRSHDVVLAGFGLMVGRFGDALGTAVSLSLSTNIVAQVAVTATLFVAAVFAFYQLFHQLFLQAPRAKSDQEVFEAFAVRHALSPREREILRHVLDGQTNAETAAALYVSESTVKFHMRNLLKKTECKNRSDLLAKYAAERKAGQ